MSTQTNQKYLGLCSWIPTLLILASPLHALAEGGNGAGNGTDAFAGSLAMKKLMDTRDGLSVEEKIYDLWVRAEGSIPNLEDSQKEKIWVGLNVVNIGEKSYWGDRGYGTLMDKYQKEVLVVRTLPALKAGNIELKPAQVFGQFSSTMNFTGDLDPRKGYYCTLESLKCARNFFPYENRPELGGSQEDSEIIKPVEFLSTGALVKSTLKRDGFPPIEYRQIDANTLVGVRKIRATTKEEKPCPDAKEVYRKEKKTEKEYRYLFGLYGLKYMVDVEKDVDVLDHWELANDYGVPGVCEVHYLFKTNIDF